MLKAGFEASLACGGLGGASEHFCPSGIRTGPANTISPPSTRRASKLRGARCQLCWTGENTVLPRRLGCCAMSCFMGSTMTEILLCFQWYSFMAVITQRYESFTINGMDHQNLPSSLFASLPYKLPRIDLISCRPAQRESH